MIRRSGLAWGLAVSVLLHAALFSPVVASWMAQALGADGSPLATIRRPDGPTEASLPAPPTSEDRPNEPAPEPEPPEAITLGDDAAPDTPAAAWIPWEAFEAMRAPRGAVDQPAVQSRVTPSPDAPVDVRMPSPPASPTAPSPTSPPASAASRALAVAPPAPPAPPVLPAPPSPASPGAASAGASEREPVALPPALAGSPSAGAARRQEPGSAPTEGRIIGEQQASAPPIPMAPAEGPGLLSADVDQPPRMSTPAVDAFGPEPTERLPGSREASDQRDPSPDPDAPLRRRPDPSPDASSADAAREDDDESAPGSRDASEMAPDDVAQAAPDAAPEEPSPAAPATSASTDAAPARPTAAPRDEQDLPPVRVLPDEPVVVVGQVITARGLRITTAAPEWSVVALMSARPTNPDVRVTFSPAGEVIHARIVKSSGYGSVDAPILISLYRWRASGERLETLDRPFELGIRLILR